MTVTEFIKQAQAYYGDYRPGALAHVQGYLQRYKGYQLDALWRQVLVDYSGRWNYPPDIAILEEAARILDKNSPGYSEKAWLPDAGQKQLPEPLDDTDRDVVTGILADWRAKVKE